MNSRSAIILTVAILLAACGGGVRAPEATGPLTPQQAFWASLEKLCGRAFAGTAVESPPGDTSFAGKKLVMHVSSCEPGRILIPFHVGSDRSRTWVVTRTLGGLQLKHDHRHMDGEPDSLTQYGGETFEPGTPTKQEFHADAYTSTLIPAARSNVWTMEVHADSMFVYALNRVGTDRRFRIEFDLTRQVPLPPATWGRDEY